MLLSISSLDIIYIEISVSSIDIINWIVDIDSNLDSIFYLYRVSTRQNVYIEISIWRQRAQFRLSHKISDFDPAMRASMNTNIIFRSKYSGDLDGISKMFGNEFSKIVPALPVGYSIFHLADMGDPFIILWRPIYSRS